MNDYISKLKKLESSYSNVIINSLSKKKNLEATIDFISKKTQEILPNKTYSDDIYENIKHLILISPKEMLEHKDALYTGKESNPELENYKKLYESLFRDKEYGENDKKYKWPIKIIQELSLNVCPYCNRNYINPRGNSQGGQTDHFFSHNDYPILSISLYNLVPSCSTCNLIKRDQSITCHPFLAENRYLKFNFTLTDVSQWKITIEENKEYSSLINKLKLEEAYEVNELDINKMYEIEQNYSKPYRDRLKKLFQDNDSRHNSNMTDQYIDRMLFGDIVDNKEEEFRNISLSYLRYDFYDFLKKKRK